MTEPMFTPEEIHASTILWSNLFGLCVGFFGFFAATYSEPGKYNQLIRCAGLGWIIFWMVPPLGRLWSTMVFQ